jgi:hypothetical protein
MPGAAVSFSFLSRMKGIIGMKGMVLAIGLGGVAADFYLGAAKVDRQVGGVFAKEHAGVKDDDTPLLDDAAPALSQLVGKGISETFSMNP